MKAVTNTIESIVFGKTRGRSSVEEILAFKGILHMTSAKAPKWSKRHLKTFYKNVTNNYSIQG